MFAIVIAAAVAAQLPGGQLAARTLGQQPGRDPSLLHRDAGRIVEEKERAQEEALRKLVAQGGPEAEAAEVLARLAATLRARGLALAISAQADADAGKQDAAQLARALSAQARTEAVARYRELLRKYPRWQRQDEALFFLADTLQDSGREDEAVQAARELTRRFPASLWAPDSHVFIGEQLFDQAKLEEALREYRAAAAVPSAEVFPYALYKAAWCRFNQNGFADAMQLLHEVVQVSTARAVQGGGQRQVQLAREARRDYVLVYARASRFEQARDEFARLFGKDDGLHMLELYARLLFDTGRDPEAQGVSRQLLDLHDSTAGAALDQTRVLLIAARTGKRRDIIREAQALVEVFRRVRAHPTTAQAQRDALAEAERLAEESLRELAVRSHNEAKKTGLDEAFAATRALYAEYLALFPDAEQAYELRFFDAELLYGLGDKQEAAALYEAVARLDVAAQKAGRKPGRWEDRAAWGAVLARDESAREQEKPQGAQKAKALQQQKAAQQQRPAVARRPLTAREELLARACALYLDAVPAGEHAVEVAFKLGRLRYLSGALDEALDKLAWVATKHPENELAEFAANLVLDIENLKGDPAAVHARATRFLADRKLVAHGTLAQDLARVEEQSAYALSDGARGDEAKAQALLGFASSHPRGALADKALFGAAAALSRAGRIDDAVEARARLAKEQPQSPLVPRALLASADDRAQVGDFGESAALLERYFAGYRQRADTAKWRRAHNQAAKGGAEGRVFDEAHAKAALHDAALLREARGELKLALQDRNAALAAWKSAPDREETQLAAAQLGARLGMAAQAGHKLAALARAASGKPAVAIVAFRESARAYARARETTHAAGLWGELEKSWRAMGPKAREKAGHEASAAAAEAHLALGARAFEEYRRQRIEPPLLRTLSRKIGLLQAVKKRDEEVVGLREAEPAVCALAQLGEAQVLLAQGIAQSPAPRGLNAEERKLYREQLDEKAQPLLAEARETLQDAGARARALGVAGACATKVQALLGKLPGGATARVQLPQMKVAVAQVPAFIDASGRPLPGAASGEEDEQQGALAPASRPAASEPPAAHIDSNRDEQGAPPR